ncbi:MAG: hypothetical protein NTY01_24310 [Verrucomicrobia bacterium]|nr:hypothetical protein [Verrucomicrobiota bacterium]
MRRRILRDPEYAAWLTKWFYENPSAWASIHRVCIMATTRPPVVTGKGTGRKVPPRQRAAACRQAVLDYLAAQFAFAFDAEGMARHLNGDAVLSRYYNPEGPGWTEREIERAADALVARGLARFNFTWFCDRKYYQATSKGMRTALPESKGKQ